METKSVATAVALESPVAGEIKAIDPAIKLGAQIVVGQHIALIHNEGTTACATTVEANQGGVVTDVLVRVGNHVRQGAPLIELNVRPLSTT